MRPLVLSLLPRYQDECGSHKQTRIPVAMVN